MEPILIDVNNNNVSLRDRKYFAELWDRCGLERIKMCAQRRQLQWFGLMDADNWVRRSMYIIVHGHY